MLYAFRFFTSTKQYIIMKTKITLLIWIALFTASSLSAQDSGRESYKLPDNWSINANFGSSLFWGDLRVYDIYPVSNYENERKWAYGVIIGKRLSPVFEIRGQLLNGKLSGTKRTEKQYFNADIFEYNLHTTIDFVNLIYGYNPDRKLNFYGSVGIGFVDFRSVKRQLGTNKYLDSRGWSANGTVKEKRTTETVIPFGFGAKYNFDRRFSVTGDVMWRAANTDLIDVTKGGSKYDMYSYISLGVTYRFNFRGGNDMYKADKSSKAKAGYTPDPALYNKIDSLNNRVKAVEDKANTLDDKSRELENKVKALEKENQELKNRPVQDVSGQKVDIEKLKREITLEVIDSMSRIMPKNNQSVIISPYMQFSVFFDVNKYIIKDSEKDKVAAIAEYLKKDKGLKMKLIGHADQSGAPKYNEWLTQKRAEAVRDMLVNEFGIEKERLTVESRGQSDPFSGKYYDINRRVDFLKQ